MADYKNCSIGALNELIILNGLCASDASYTGLRIMEVTGTSKVESCGTHYTIEELRKAAIGVAADGLPAIRLWITVKKTGVGLTPCAACSNIGDVEEIEKRFYVKTAAGEIALKMFAIT